MSATRVRLGLMSAPDLPAQIAAELAEELPELLSAASAADRFAFAIIAGPPEVQRAFELSGLAPWLPFVEPRSGRAWA